MCYASRVAFRTVDQKPHGDDFAKARELIEVRGTGALSLHDRRVMNVLYANAGTQLCDDVEHVIAISELRGLHKGGERVKDSILRLMKTVVEMPTKDRKGRPSVKLVPVLSDTTVSDDDDNPSGQVIYSFSPGMRAIIKDSTLWGRVRTAVVFAFTSKYSLALYELITARINLTHIWQEDFSVQDLRELLGVPDGKLLRVPNLIQKVVRPAEIEVNGLADFGVKIEPIRTGGTMRGLVTGFKVAWHRKDIPGLKEAYSELHRSKVGRIARLSGKVETVRPLGDLSADPTAVDEELGRLLSAMREKDQKKAPKMAR
jgi:hypothetical protein